MGVVDDALGVGQRQLATLLGQRDREVADCLVLAQLTGARGGNRVDHRGDIRVLGEVAGRTVYAVGILGVGQLPALGVQDDGARAVGLIRERLRQRVGGLLAVGARE